MVGKIFWRHPWHLIWVVLAYLPFIWAYGIPFTGDQKTYISIAMEMRERASFLIPYLFGEPNYLKPPLQYWMTLGGWKLFGFNLFGTFLPSVLALVGTAYCLNEISSHLGERKWYVSSGLWFAATVGALTFGGSAQMEIYLCLFYSAAWWSALKYLSVPDAERKPVYLYIAFLIAGACSWVKSPLYSVLWCAGFFSYLLVSGEWLMFKSRHLYLSLIAGTLFGLSWFLYILGMDGERFWNVYWEQEQAGKKGGNGGTLGDLWIPLTYLSFPLTLLVITALRSVFLGRRTVAIMRFVMCWSWGPALFFSLYPYRTSIYLFILVPALAVLVDWGCFRANRTRTYQWLARLTGVLMALGYTLAGYILYRAEIVPEWVTIGLAFAGVLAMGMLWMGWIRTFLVSVLAGFLFIRIASVEIMRPTMDSLRGMIPIEKGMRIGMLDESRNIWHELGLVAVTLKQPFERLYGLDDLLEILENGGTVILSDEEWSKYSQTLEAYLGERGKSLESLVWKRFKRGARLPVKQVLLNGRAGVEDWNSVMTREFRVLRAARLGR